MSYIESVAWPSIAIKVEFLKTLKDVCEGKMFVEAESARLHLALALLHESNGEVELACDMIQDVHVETYGSLSKKEKAEYILEQIRLNLSRKDYVRALIQSRKMSRKVIEEDGFVEIKLKFYRMMVQYHSYEKETWEICQCYFKMYEANKAKELNEEKVNCLQSCIIFLLLSKSDNHQVDMMHRIKTVALAEGLNDYGAILTLFATKEIIPSPFPGQDLFKSHPCLSQALNAGESADLFFIDTIHSRIVEHNIRVISTYYTKIQIPRLCVLIQLEQDELESYLSKMFTNGDISVKIDRPAGIVDFSVSLPVETVLSDWSSDISKLLHIMESTCHLINRENMIYKV